MGYWKSKVVPTMKKFFEKKKAHVEEKSPEAVEVVEEVVKTQEPTKVEETKPVETVEEVVKPEEPTKVEETKPVEVTTEKKEIEIVEEKNEEVTPAPAATEEKKTVVEEEEKAAVEEKTPAVEEVKKDVTAPVVDTPSTKAKDGFRRFLKWGHK